MKKLILNAITALCLSIILVSCQSGTFHWTTDYVKLSVNNNGFLTEWTNLASSETYYPDQAESPLLQIRKDSVYYQPDNMVKGETEGLFILSFSDLDIKAQIKVRAESSHIVFELVECDKADELDLIVWGPYANTINQIIGEIVGVVRDSSFAIGIQSLNIRTLGGFPSQENDQDPSYDIFETNSFNRSILK